MKQRRGDQETRRQTSEVRTPGCGRATPFSALRTTPSRGFTLLEVSVAVAILALVLVTLLGLKNRSVQDVILAERITTATFLAQRLMVETLSARSLSLAEDDGEFEEEEFEDYAWKKTISLTPLSPIKEIRVAVLWKEGEREEQVELVTYENK